MPYELGDHLHNAAMWVAARSVQRRAKGLTTTRVVEAIESAGLRHEAARLARLTADQFDAAHRKLRAQIARKLGLTQGRAAKIVNVYFKIAVVCPAQNEHAKSRAAVFHPPIDHRLLAGLAKTSEGALRTELRALCRAGWTSFDCDAYERAIRAVRSWLQVKGHPQELWRAEECWRP